MDGERRKMSFGAGLLSFLLCLLLFVTSLGAIAVFAVRSAVTREALEDIVDDIDITEIGFPDETGEKVTFLDLIEDNWGDLLKASGVKSKTIAKAFDQPYLRDYVKDALGNYIAFFLEGEELEPLTAEGVRKFLKKRADDLYDDSRGIIIYNDSGKKADDTGMPAFRLTGKDIDELFEEAGSDSLDEEFLSGILGVPAGLMARFLSGTSMLALAGLSGLFILVLLLIHLRRVRRGFRFAGWTLVLSGGFAAAGGMLLGRLLADRDLGPVQAMAEGLGTGLVRTGGMAAAAGLAMAVVLVLLCRLFSRGK